MNKYEDIKRNSVIYKPDKINLIKNPAMGWVLYIGEDDSFEDADSFWSIVDECGASCKASILYIRLPWSIFEPEEKKYAWLHDENYKKYINGARSRNLQLAFRVVNNSDDYFQMSTPQYVKDAGAEGYWSQDKWNPYVFDPIFREKYECFIRAFANEYNDPQRVAYIDGEGIGRWGELHDVKGTKEQQIDCLYWVTKVYSKYFTKVLLGGQYGSTGTFTYKQQESFMLDASRNYIIRRDSFGSPRWLHPDHITELRNWFPQVPIYAENCYHHLKGREDWFQGDGFGTYRDVFVSTLKDALECRANTLDLRNSCDAVLWMENKDLVDCFIRYGGYRILPNNITYQDEINTSKPQFIEHSWINIGMGMLPNHVQQWNYKYQVAFCLIDKTTEEVVYQHIDPQVEPSDWIKGSEYTYKTYMSLSGVEDGTYQLAVAIVDTTMNNQPAIQLAIKEHLKTHTGWYILGDIKVRNCMNVKSHPIPMVGNIAPYAEVHSNLSMKDSIDLINDNSVLHPCTSYGNPQFPGNILLEFDQIIETEKITLACHFGVKQGISNIDIEYEGDNCWIKVKENLDIGWGSSEKIAQYKDIFFEKVCTKKIRVIINDANLSDGYFNIAQIKVWGSMEKDNVAPLAKVSTTLESVDCCTINNINDSRPSRYKWYTMDEASLPGYITFDFGQTIIETDKLSLMTEYGAHQGITNMDIEYYHEEKWHCIKSNAPIKWQNDKGTMETIHIAYPNLHTTKLRIKINEGNPIGQGISISQMRIWGKVT